MSKSMREVENKNMKQAARENTWNFCWTNIIYNKQKIYAVIYNKSLQYIN